MTRIIRLQWSWRGTDLPGGSESPPSKISPLVLLPGHTAGLLSVTTTATASLSFFPEKNKKTTQSGPTVVRPSLFQILARRRGLSSAFEAAPTPSPPPPAPEEGDVPTAGTPAGLVFHVRPTDPSTASWPGVSAVGTGDTAQPGAVSSRSPPRSRTRRAGDRWLPRLCTHRVGFTDGVQHQHPLTAESAPLGLLLKINS